MTLGHYGLEKSVSLLALSQWCRAVTLRESERTLSTSRFMGS